jgi:osmotically-inducible protein OsmY
MLAGVCALIVASQSLIAAPSVTQPPMRHPVDAERSSDEAVQRAVTQRLIDHVIPPDGVIIVTVKQGLATMRGRVGSVWTRTEAVRQALHVGGVVNVANELTIERWPDDQIDQQIGEWMYRSVF